MSIPTQLLAKTALLSTFALASSLSAAATQWCQGKITHAWIDNAGHVFIWSTWRGDHTQICNVNTDWKGIGPTICKNWYATAVLAVASGKKVIVTVDAPSCETMPTYGASPAPWYVMLTHEQ